MVRVPTYERTESLRPAFQQGINVQASPDAFGAAIGRGLKSVAAGGMQLADSVQRVEELKATLTAKDSLTAFERDKMELDYGPNGFMTTQGRNAVEGRSAYNAALEELKKKHSPQAGLAAQKYGDAATAAVTQGMRQGIMHSAQGQKDWAASSSTARLSLYQDQALSGYDKPDEVKKSLGLGFAEIDAQAELMGWGPEVVQLKRQEFSSQVHANVAIAMASKPSGARSALAYVKENAGSMDPKTRLDIENKLRPFAVDEEAQGVVNEIVSGGRTVAELPGDIVGEVAGVSKGGGGPTRSKAFLMSKSAHKDRPGDTANLDDAFADNLAALIQDAPAHIREGLGLGSAYRSNERQKELFERSDKTGRMVAFPAGYTKPDGSVARGSNHLHGRAVDLAYNGARLDRAPQEVKDWVHQNAAAYGLRFPMSWEPWHIEPSKGGGVAAGTVVPARDGVSARASMPAYGDAMARINSIADPDVRASAMKQLNAQFEMRSKLESAQSDEAKNQIWTMMMQNTPLSAIPLDLKIAAGREAVSGFMDFEAKAGDVKTDPALYAKLNELAATNPLEFAQLDLTAPEILNGLSREDWKTAQNKKSSVLGDERKAQEDGTVYREAYKVAEEMYGAAGILTGNSNAAQAADNVRREALFRDAMRLETQQFMEANNGKRPGYEELRAMAAMLTMRAIAAEKRTNAVTSFFDSDGLDDVWNGRLFERVDAPPGTEMRFDAKYEDIPADWVSAITIALTNKNGTAPTKQQIVEEWMKTAMEIVGTN